MPFDRPQDSQPQRDPLIGSEADQQQLDRIEANLTPRGRELLTELHNALVTNHKDLARRVGADPSVRSYLALRTQFWAALRAHNGMTPEEFLKLRREQMFALLEVIAR